MRTNLSQKFFVKWCESAPPKYANANRIMSLCEDFVNAYTCPDGEGDVECKAAALQEYLSSCEPIMPKVS